MVFHAGTGAISLWPRKLALVPVCRESAGTGANALELALALMFFC